MSGVFKEKQKKSLSCFVRFFFATYLIKWINSCWIFTLAALLSQVGRWKGQYEEVHMISSRDEGTKSSSGDEGRRHKPSAVVYTEKPLLIFNPFLSLLGRTTDDRKRHTGKGAWNPPPPRRRGKTWLRWVQGGGGGDGEQLLHRFSTWVVLISL